jgi:glutamate/tyrosine decarboxylase-like PLP-dependent enzyme
MANATALAVARRARIGDGDVPRGPIYISDQAHSCSRRAARLLGMSPGQLRVVPTRDDLTINVGALQHMVNSDRRRKEIDRGIRTI